TGELIATVGRAGGQAGRVGGGEPTGRDGVIGAADDQRAGRAACGAVVASACGNLVRREEVPVIAGQVVAVNAFIGEHQLAAAPDLAPRRADQCFAEVTGFGHRAACVDFHAVEAATRNQVDDAG